MAGESRTSPSLRVLQINLNHCRAAQDLVMQIVRERNIDLLAISEQYEDRAEGSGWFADKTGRAAVVICSELTRVENVGDTGLGFRMVTVRGIRFYSCYISPNVDQQTFEAFLRDLEISVRRGTGGALIAGDFNSKSRSWGCRVTDVRGALLDMFIASLSLIVLNVGDTYTCRRGREALLWT